MYSCIQHDKDYLFDVSYTYYTILLIYFCKILLVTKLQLCSVEPFKWWILVKGLMI